MKDAHPRLPDDVLKARYSAYLKHGKSLRAAAMALNVDRAAFRKSVLHYEMKFGKPDESGLEFPDFPPDSLPIERVIDTLKERSAIRRASYAAHTWFPVKVKDSKPIGIMWFGDPHVDDDGCDWTLLHRHIDLCKQPGVYAVNIGDTTNNWSGRLLKKYADQETSVSTARRLAAWFLLESGIRWLVWLMGNHDAWNDGAEVLSQMAKRHSTQKVVMHDWEARFSLNFPNGCKINIWAAHDFPGDSMWNPMHGPVKAARFGADTDLLVCGHKHNWGISQWELADKGTTPTMIRTRGYKFNDDYARRIGKPDQDEGSSIFTVINPHSQTKAGRVMAFADVEQGVNYLQWLRSQY
jgi:hypothetical protein